MESFVTLTQILDQRKGNPNCEFNGFLEDYVASLEEDHPQIQLFRKILEKNCDFRILVHYRFNINHELISNQIIRYKDIQKIPAYQFDLPYLIYGQNEDKELCGLILLEGKEDAYILAKGYYLALTEQGSILEAVKNQCVSCNTEHPNLFKAMDKLHDDHLKAGAVQRMLDSDIFCNYQDLLDVVQGVSIKVQNKVKDFIKSVENKEAVIYPAVVHWFLLKKMVYVHTMMNRNLLLQDCEGDVRKQRHLAKLNSDHVQFLMYSEMWRM
jgi:hypothetical protein